MDCKFLQIVFYFLFFFLTISTSIAQSSIPSNAEDKINERLENIAENTDQELDYTQLTEELQYLKEHPININSATKEDLEKIIFLNDIEINNLLNYIKKNGKFLSIYELQSVEGFYLDLIYKIIPLFMFQLKLK